MPLPPKTMPMTLRSTTVADAATDDSRRDSKMDDVKYRPDRDCVIDWDYYCGVLL